MRGPIRGGDLSSLAGVLTKYLPQDELVTRTAKKWKVAAKAGKLKSVSAKVTGIVVNGTGFGEVVVKKTKIGELTVK